MTHYGFSKNLFKKQNKETLEDWGKKLTDISLSIESTFQDKNNYRNVIEKIQDMTKHELIEYCYDIVDDIIDSEIGNYSCFFWNDGGSDYGREYLREIINEKNELLDDFIDEFFNGIDYDEYLDSFWKDEIKIYKLERMSLELGDDCPDYSSERNTNKLITLWKKYKLSHETVELFD
jgi:hypothetical protein